ncbi:MAG: NYN domain-containing protein [Patescibacteria group bacterium]
MNPRKNNYAFIDSQNLHKGIEACGWKLDFARFRVYLRDKYDVEKAYLFIGYLPGNESLYTHLQQSGYLVIFKPTLEYKKDGGTYTKGNVDAELVLHCMIQFPHYDKAIIVSGDGDFHCLIEYLEKQEKLERLLVPNKKRYSALLRRFISRIGYLDGLRHKLERRKR